MYMEWWMVGLFIFSSAYMHYRSYDDGFKKGWKGACDLMEEKIKEKVRGI